MAIRVVLFSVFAMGGVVVAFVYTVTQKLGIQFDFLIGAMPLAAAVIFGTQKVRSSLLQFTSISYKFPLVQDLLQV
ncbi:hypothetical protein C0995_000197 [Termitomyces sp. Mi166|nr:hypothetical protein C0995_000197 [Termitomyces sp. Mi166\